MNVFHIISVGGVKDEYFRAAAAEYEKRLTSYGRVIKTEIPQKRLPSDPSDGEISAALAAEGERVLAAIPKRAYVTALCVEGKLFPSSEALAEHFGRALDMGASELTFIIGSSHGLSDAVKKSADLRLSLSPLTFPHTMMQSILYEVLYRSMTIIHGGSYHK
ncbi:MAG: 23S rRNA (pseudouridine(1915)-N(3))-methyltransferase RlmH [Firmicutes bacterium]|nr:23S rRNA (pseudouridine(1915)-N(3))-methyltransferase RlmH [Bacillota bacterium]MCD7830985.1 23S rRNA (pseudouridine(1915)-N(3))-methyltransferase RlmH [Bacillota bacterium]